MQHNKTIYLHTLLIFFCTNSHSMEIEYHTAGKPLSEYHFETRETNWSSGAKKGKIVTPELYVHKGELEKPLSQMKIGLSLNDDGVEHIIPADDPLRKDNSLLVALNARVADEFGDPKAIRNLYELASRGEPLSSCYSICRVEPIQIRPEFLLIRKKLGPKKGTLSYNLYVNLALDINADNSKDALYTVTQGRDARNTALETALTAGGLEDDSITLIKSFDENSPEELAKIQKIRKAIHQERQTLVKLVTAIQSWLRGSVSCKALPPLVKGKSHSSYSKIGGNTTIIFSDAKEI